MNKMSLQKISLLVTSSLVVVLLSYLLVPAEFPVPKAPGAILVVGAGSGIGRHVAERLKQEYSEFTIYGLIRKEAHVEQLTTLGIKPILADLTDDAATLKEAITSAIANDPLVGVFVSAGLPIPNVPIEFLEVSTLQDIYNVNVFGLVRLLQATLPFLKRQRLLSTDGGARIVLMGSVTSHVTPSFMGADPFRAVETIADALRREIKHMGISVSTIQAGFVDSPIIPKTHLADKEWKKQQTAQSSLVNDDDDDDDDNDDDNSNTIDDVLQRDYPTLVVHDLPW